MDLRGHGIVTSMAFAERDPEAVRSFFRGSIGGLKAVSVDPRAGIAAMTKREPLLDKVPELDRLAMTRGVAIMADNVRGTGLGALELARMDGLVTINTEVNGIASLPAAGSLFSAAFPSPQAERMP